MTLDDLGPRICIMGPSNSGKSTLATAIVQNPAEAVQPF
jgi:adenylate kinase family enzyme